MKLNLFAPINQLGYGIASLNILKALYKRGHTIYLHPIGGPRIEAPSTEHHIIEECAVNAEKYDSSSPCLKIWHPSDLKYMIGKGTHIGFPIFELDRFSENETYQLNQLDAIFVCSHWAKQVCEQAGIKKPIYVVPLGVDREIFHEDIKLFDENDIAKDAATKFLNIGKWEIRKGHDVIIEAFNLAFKQSDNVRLIMNCVNPFIGEKGNTEWINMYMSSPLRDKIHIFNQRLNSQENVAHLMSSVDCGIFPARAEGWNLELLEMMSCGKMVITTNVTGHTEFVNSQNSYLIECNEMEDAFDNIFFHNQGQWYTFGEDQIEQLAEYMKKIHGIKQMYQGTKDILKNFEGIKTAQQFTWENSVIHIEKSLLC